MTELNGEMLTILGASIFVVALLYSCVGHGGASGYIAVMALAGMAPASLLGGTIGSLAGSRHLPLAAIARTLSVVLVIAGVKLILM